MNLSRGLTVELNIVLWKSTRSDLLWGWVISGKHCAFRWKVGKIVMGPCSFLISEHQLTLMPEKKWRICKFLEIFWDSYVKTIPVLLNSMLLFPKLLLPSYLCLRRKVATLNPSSSCCLWHMPAQGDKSLCHLHRARPASALVSGQHC